MKKKIMKIRKEIIQLVLKNSFHIKTTILQHYLYKRWLLKVWREWRRAVEFTKICCEHELKITLSNIYFELVKLHLNQISTKLKRVSFKIKSVHILLATGLLTH